MNNDALSDLSIAESEFCFIDVETTGLSPSDNSVIEIGAVYVSRLKIGKKFSSFLNPGRDVPYFITQLTGITNEDVSDAPFFEEIASQLREFVSDSIIGGHNFAFDNSFLKKEFAYCGEEYLDNPQVCTLRIARRLYPALRSKSLGNVANHLRLKNLNAHRALDDALVTAKIFIKMVKELKEKEGIITNGELLNYQYVPQSKPAVKIKKKLGQDIAALPSTPGIYFYLNSRDEIIYIGKAKSLKDRISSYFSMAAPRKTKKILSNSSRLKIALTNSELTALLAEAEMIKLHKPKFNTLLKKYGNKYFLRFMNEHNYPRVELCREFDFDGNDYFGPFSKREKATTLIELIDKTFSLRECSDKEFARKRKCLLADIERCNAPCVLDDTEAYKEELAKVYEFLYGKNQFALNRLLGKMKEYSEMQKYEAAGEYKRLVELILSQIHRSSLIAEPINSASVLFEITGLTSKDYILLIAGKIYIKDNITGPDNSFDEAIDDFYEDTINLQYMPNEEDLEKLKISLSWLIKNRNKVRIFYLKEFISKQKLYESLSRFTQQSYKQNEISFEIKDLMSSLSE
jgi:DNA polymerase III subunit epsilon